MWIYLEATEYAAEDADITFQLYELLLLNSKKKNLEDLFYKIEIPLMKVLAKWNWQGISLDEKLAGNKRKH